MGDRRSRKIVIHHLKCSRVWGGGSGFTSWSSRSSKSNLDTSHEGWAWAGTHWVRGKNQKTGSSLGWTCTAIFKMDNQQEPTV